jgi:hypothetical protein
MKKKLIRIGNGMAGMRTPEELPKIAPDRYGLAAPGAQAYDSAAADNALKPEIDRAALMPSYHLFGAA